MHTLNTDISNISEASSREGVRMKKKVEPGIWRVGPNRYLVEATVDRGARRARKVVEGTVHDAREQKQALRVKLLTDTDRSLKSVITVNDVLDYYVKNHFERTSRYKIGSGKHIIETLKKEFGVLAADKLSTKTVSQWVFRMQNTATGRGECYSAAGINPYITTLKSAYGFCVDSGMIQLSPVAKVQLLEVKPQKKEIIPEDVLKTFRESLPKWCLPLMSFKELVPCRYLELLKVRMDQVDTVTRRIILEQDQTKTGENRELPIPSVMVGYFEQMKAWGSQWAFARPFHKTDGTVEFRQLARNAVTVEFRKVREANGLPKTILFRKLRHNVISQWLRRFDVDLVSEVAGASAETLRKYYDVIPIEEKLKAADAFSEKCEHSANTLTLKLAKLG